MTYVVKGLPAEDFSALIGLPDEALAERGAKRVIASSKPGFPCRVTLEDADPGETVLLVNHASNDVASPYRFAFAIYVREKAQRAAEFVGELPPVFFGRTISLKRFNEEGALVGASLATGPAIDAEIRAAFDDDAVASLHAHNAAPGCFAAEIRRQNL